MYGFGCTHFLAFGERMGRIKLRRSIKVLVIIFCIFAGICLTQIIIAKMENIVAVSIFDGDCGVAVSAKIKKENSNYLGIDESELEITIKNTTEKEIAAIKFYAVSFDVYGDEIQGRGGSGDLFTDDAISPGETTQISYFSSYLDRPFNQSVKMVKLYVYSVYFSDGSEWGDRNATASEIIKAAPTIEVTVVD